MRHLGDFGVLREQIDATFGYFGATIRVHPDVTDFSLGGAWDAVPDDATLSETMRAMAAAAVHPDDVDEFVRLALANRQRIKDVGDVLGDIVAKLTEEETGRPTQRPDDSSNGPQNTTTTSPGGVSSEAARALTLLPGRPDLKDMVLQADEHRRKQTG